MMRLYMGCGTRRMTSTTMVLAILDDMTEPTFSFFLLVSAIGYRPFLPVIAAFFWAVVFAAAVLGAAFLTVAAWEAAFLAAFWPAAFDVLGATLVTNGTGAAAA